MNRHLSFVARIGITTLWLLGPNQVLQAATSDWVGPGADFNTASNWSAGTPTDIAGFNNAAPTSISLLNSAALNGMTFNPGASAYAIAVSGGHPILRLNGAGITNNSANTQTFSNNYGGIIFANSASAGSNVAIINDNNAGTSFWDSSSAGNANITNTNGSATVFSGASTGQNSSIFNNGFGTATFFEDNSTAAQTTITNYGGDLSFWQNATAGNATIVNTGGGLMTFETVSTAGNATITNNSGGVLAFHSESTGGNARITNDGGYFFMDGLSSSGMTAGSIAGAGSFFLGSKSLTVGSNGLSTTVSGVISGYLGSLVKVGNGVLTLSGGNTYTGGTTINGGILRAVAANTFYNGGAIRLANTAGASLELNGFNQTIGSLSGGGTSGGHTVLGSAILTTGTDNTSTLYAGNISGFGTLVKTGNGTFTISGNNSYMGGTIINGGVLKVGSYDALPVYSLALANASGARLDLNGFDTTLWSLSGGGALGGNIDLGGATLTVGSGLNPSMVYAGAISGPGALEKTGTGLLTLSGVNSYSGPTIINQGFIVAGAANTLSSASRVMLADTQVGSVLRLNGFNQTIGSLSGGGSSGGVVMLDDATLTVGADNTSTTFGGEINGGTGSLVKIGDGTLTLASNANSIGHTTIDDGALSVTGTLGNGNVTVGSQGTLSGTGLVSSVVNNGSVTPGLNGAGTLRTTGYSGTGALNIQFDGTTHNSLSVNGNADLNGGTLNVTGTNFTSGQYEILSSAGATGAFAQINTPQTAFLRFDPLYTGPDVELIIRNLSFADVGLNANQRSLASVLDQERSSAHPSFSAVINALSNLATAEEGQAAFTQMSGDSLTFFQSVGLRNAASFIAQMNDRAYYAGRSAVPPVQLAYDGDARSLRGIGGSLSKNGLWARGVGFFDRTDGDSSVGSPGADADTAGFQAGFDRNIGDEGLAGISGGYADTSLSVEDRSSSGDAKTYQIGLYGRYAPNPWFLNTALGYAGSSNDMTRSIAFSGVNGQAAAGFDGMVISGFLEGGYSFKAGDASSVEPSASLRQSHIEQDAFTESGAPGLNLSVDEQTQDSTVGSLALRLNHSFGSRSSHPLMVSLRTGWEHEFADTNNVITAQFADAPGATFSAQGTPRQRDAGLVGVEGQVAISKAVSGFASYSVRFASDQNTQGIVGGLNLKW